MGGVQSAETDPENPENVTKGWYPHPFVKEGSIYKNTAAQKIWEIPSGKTDCVWDFDNAKCPTGYGKNVYKLNWRQCGPLGSKRWAPCKAKYTDQDILNCFENDKALKACHPDIKNGSINISDGINTTYEESRKRALEYAFINDINISKFPKLNNPDCPLYDQVAKKICLENMTFDGHPINGGMNRINCKEWCRRKYSKGEQTCAPVANEFCLKDRNKSSNLPVCTSALSAQKGNVTEEAYKQQQIEQKYNEWVRKMNDGINIFKDPEFKTFSEHSDLHLMPTIRNQLDTLWNDYCSKIGSDPVERERCSCINAGKEVENQNYGVRPDCLSQKCSNSIIAYRPWNTIRQRSGETCPNVCSQVIQARAGNIAIIDNINFVQNCFNSTDSQVQDAIQSSMNESIATVIESYMIGCIYTNNTIVTNKSATVDQTLSNKEYYLTIRDDIKDYTTNYGFLLESQVATATKVLSEINDNIITKSSPAMTTYYAIDFNAGTDSDTKKQEFEQALNTVIQSATPLKTLTQSIENLTQSMKPIVDDYKLKKQAFIDEVSTALDNIGADFPNTSQINLKIAQLEQHGKSIDDMKLIRDDALQIISNYQLIKNKELEDTQIKIEETRPIINQLISKLDNVSDETVIEYKDKWTIINQISDQTVLLTKMQEFKSQLEGYLKAKTDIGTLDKPTDDIKISETSSESGISLWIIGLIGFGMIIFVIIFIILKRKSKKLRGSNGPLQLTLSSN